MITRITLILLSLFTLQVVAAQDRIDREIQRAENDPTTTYAVCSERRDPTTHEIVKSSKVLVVNDGMARKVRRAFDNERQRAVSLEMVNGGAAYTMTFEKNGERRVYTLVRQRDGSWVITVDRRSGSALSPTSEYFELVPVIFISDFSMDT